eukprot:110784_1
MFVISVIFRRALPNIKLNSFRRRIHIIATPNKKQFVLTAHKLKYPVIYTKCASKPKNQIKSTCTDPIILMFAAGQRLDDYSWLTQHLSHYSDIITIGHCTTPHISNSQNSIQQYKECMTNFDTDIECVKNTLDYFEIKKANFVGISYGGVLSYLFAKQYPLRVNSMLLSSVGLYLSNECTNNIINGLKFHLKQDYKNSAKIVAKMFTNDRTLQRVLSLYFKSLFESSNVFPHQFQYHGERVLKHFSLDAFTCNINKFYDNVNSMNIHTLTICGKDDNLFPLDSLLNLTQTIQNCMSVIVNGGHLWQSHPKYMQSVFCDITTNFLTTSSDQFLDGKYINLGGLEESEMIVTI